MTVAHWTWERREVERCTLLCTAKEALITISIDIAPHTDTRRLTLKVPENRHESSRRESHFHGFELCNHDAAMNRGARCADRGQGGHAPVSSG